LNSPHIKFGLVAPRAAIDHATLPTVNSTGVLRGIIGGAEFSQTAVALLAILASLFPATKVAAYSVLSMKLHDSAWTPH